MFGIKKKITGLVLAGMVLLQLSPALALPVAAASNDEQPSVIADSPNKVSSPDVEYIDIAKAEKLQIENLKPVDSGGQGSISAEIARARQPLANEALAGKTRILSSRSLTPLSGEPSPLIEYYDGIENNNVDYILYYLSQTQNQDGSFGDSNQYELTADIVLLLAQFNRQGSGQFNLALNYLLQTEPKNNREKAIKALILSASGNDPTALLDDLAGQQNEDGGFGYEAGYLSDILTTERAIAAFWQADYSLQEKLPQALLYVIGQIKDDGSIVYNDGTPPSYYLVNKTLESFKPFAGMPMDLGALVQNKVNAMLGWLGNNFDSESEQLLNTEDVIDALMTLRSFAFYGAEPEKQTALRSQSKSAQNADGSFGSSLFSTLAGMQALAGPDLKISNLQSESELVNQQPARFSVVITNQGQTGAENIVIYQFIDNFYFSRLNLADINVPVLLPGEQVNLTINNNDTLSFIGSTNIKFYIESNGEADYENNWVDQDFAFGTAGNGTPGLPVYYIAQKNAGPNNTPRVNMKWAAKDDPNRAGYEILYRPKGAGDWYSYSVPNSTEQIFLWPFAEDATFEFSLGVLHNNLNDITYFSAITEVTLSGNESKYLGNVTGIATLNNQPTSGLETEGPSVNNISDANGVIEYFNVPNGSGVAGVNKVGYEKILTKFPIVAEQTTENVRLFTRLVEDSIPPTVSIINAEGRYEGAIIYPEVKNQREAAISVVGTDETAVKEADFYYWDPGEQAWIYIATFAADFSPNLVEVKVGGRWYVPSSLLGPGYKIKALLRDLRGNESQFIVSESFEIFDGTLPTGSVAVEGLNNNQWSLGQEKTIKWQIDSANALRAITHVRLYYNNDNADIASNLAPTQTENSYVMPLNTGYAAADAFIRVEACDVNNNCASFDSPHFAIVDNTPMPHYPWGQEQSIDSMLWPSVPGLTRSLIAVFHNQDNSREFIYEQVGEGRRRLVYRKLASGAWLEPVTLAEMGYDINSGNNPRYNVHKAVQRSAGDIHLVYEIEFIGNKQENYLNYVHYHNGQVYSRRISEVDGTQATNASMAVADSGRVFIVWLQSYNENSQTGKSLLHYREGDGFASWSDVSVLTDDWTGKPAITAVQDWPTVIYRYQEQFNMRRKTESGWLAPVVINKTYIKRSDLDVFSQDADKLQYIVSPLDEQYYQWLPAIRTRADLLAVLEARNFAAKDSILETWRQNEYAYNVSSDSNLFAEGNNVYEFFYRQLSAESQSNWVYDLRHLRLQPDFNGNSRVIYDDSPLVDRSFGQSVNNFKAVQDNNKDYHLFYAKEEKKSGGGNINYPYYLFYDGAKTYFNTMISSLFRDSYEIIAASERNGFVTAFFAGVYNSADYGPTINYRLDNAAPENRAIIRGPSASLRWQSSGGPITSYRVFFGTQLHVLDQIASGLTLTEHSVTGLDIDKTYYWQVVGQYEDKLIYSNIWQFTTLPMLGHSLSGQIKYYDGVKPVAGATVILEDGAGNQAGSVLTDGAGNYQFNDVAAGDYVVRAVKGNGPGAVSIADIVKTVRHILLEEQFNSIYKIVAADADEDGTILVTDVIKMVRYILGIEGFLSGDWKFFSSDFALNETNYLSQGRTRVYSGLNSDYTEQNFVGVKMGDVNNTWR